MVVEELLGDVDGDMVVPAQLPGDAEDRSINIREGLGLLKELESIVRKDMGERERGLKMGNKRASVKGVVILM